MSILIPRRLRELREELLAQLQDNDIERKQVAEITAKGALTSQERATRSTISARLAHGVSRVAEIEAEIDAELAKHGNRTAVEARVKSRAAVAGVHSRTRQRHIDRAEQLEKWRTLSIQLFADHRQAFADDSRVVETAVKHLSDSDPQVFSRTIEHSLAALRGWDHGFEQALQNAIQDILRAASDGSATPTNDRRSTFTAAAKRAVDQLDARLPQIHAAPDADLGKNPVFVEEPATHDKWSTTITGEESKRLQRESDERAAAGQPEGKPDQWADLIRGGKRSKS